MKIEVDVQNGSRVAVVTEGAPLLCDVPSALDLTAQVYYDQGAAKLIFFKEQICPEFFDLRTKLAGEILQKFQNYQVKIAIVGDFENLSSKSLTAFVYECNKGSSVFFVPSLEDGKRRLHALPEA